MAKQRSPRLGRGLSTLLSSPLAAGHDAQSAAPETSPDQNTAAAPPKAPMAGVVRLPVHAITPNPHQPRQLFTQHNLVRLADSIREVGMMQPLIVRPVDGSEGKFELVAGERRWRAAQIAKLAEVPVIVRQLGETQSAQWALIENLQREDLNPIEKAHGFAHLIDTFGLSHEQIGQQIGINRSTVSNTLRLLHLNSDVQALVSQGALSAGLARGLAAISDPSTQLQFAKRAIHQEWSVRQLEAAVRLHSRPDESAPTPDTRKTHLHDLEQQIGHQLQTKVRIRRGRKKGSGSLSIEFYSFDQFDNLMSKFGVAIDSE